MYSFANSIIRVSSTRTISQLIFFSDKIFFYFIQRSETVLDSTPYEDSKTVNDFKIEELTDIFKIKTRLNFHLVLF